MFVTLCKSTKNNLHRSDITDKISKIIGFQRIWGMACAVSCHSVFFMRIIFTVVCTICVIFLLAFQSWSSFFSSFWKNTFIAGFSPKRRVRQIIIQCKIIYITTQNKLYLHPFSLLLTFISPLFAMALGVNKIFVSINRYLTKMYANI